MLVVVSVMTWAGSAGAVTCPTNGTWSASIPVDIGVEDHPRQPGTAGNYINNQAYFWSFHVGPLVKDVKIHWQTFNIEQGPTNPPYFDYFAVNSGASYQNWVHYRGNHTNTWEAPWGIPAPEQKYHFHWKTDYSVNYPGVPRADYVQVQCHSGLIFSQPYPMQLQQEHQGLLYGTGSKVHFYVDVPANRKLFLTLDGYPSTADFDLFASTSIQLPGPGGAYDWASASGEENEAIKTATFGSATRVYITVMSYSGEGSFTLHAYAPKYSGISRKVCSQHPIGPSGVGATLWNGFVKMMKQSALRMLQATNGTYLVETWNVHEIPTCYVGGYPATWCSTCDSSCQLCINHPLMINGACGWQSNGISDCCGVSRMPAFACGGGSVHASDWSSTIVTHEQGHAIFGMWDEYNWCDGQGNNPICSTCGCGAFCGHSLMNGPGTHVFCTGTHAGNNRHCLDGLSGVTKNTDIPTPCTYAGSNWWKLFTSFGYDTPISPNPDASYDLVFNQRALDKITVNYYNL